MALERADPIPPGIYWIDVFKRTLPSGENQDRIFNQWLVERRDTVKVIRTEHYEGQLARPGVSGAYPERDWVLFQVLKPTFRWAPDSQLGFPSRAPKGAATEATDTAQRPAPETSIVPWGWVAAGAGVAGALFLAFNWAQGKLGGSKEHDHT